MPPPPFRPPPHRISYDADEIERWIRELDVSDGWLGLDSEWRPQYVKGQRNNATALVQISTLLQTILIPIAHLPDLPSGLVAQLEDPDVRKTGVGVEDDLAKLVRENRPIAVRNVHDTRRQAQAMNLHGGMSTLLAHFGVGRDQVPKPRKVTMSNWAARPLSDDQLQYAALDAYASVWLGYAVSDREDELSRQGLSDPEVPLREIVPCFKCGREGVGSHTGHSHTPTPALMPSECSSHILQSLSFCGLCELYFQGAKALERHVKCKGGAHEAARSASFRFKCETCRKFFRSQGQKDGHDNTKAHQARESAKLFQQNFNKLQQDKGHVVVTPPALAITVPLAEPGGEGVVRAAFSVSNKARGRAVTLQAVGEVQRHPAVSLDDDVGVTGGLQAEPVSIAPGGAHEVRVAVGARWVGAVRTTLVFNLVNDAGQEFTTARRVEVKVVDPGLGGAGLGPTAPFKRKEPRPAGPRFQRLEKGERPPSDPKKTVLDFGWGRAGEPRVPDDVMKLIRDRAQPGGEAAAAVEEALEAPLTWDGFPSRWRRLLQLEEAQEHVDIRSFDMEGTVMTACGSGGRFVALKVPGMAESRPSVLKGDRILAVPAGGGDVEYEGFVHECYQEEAVIRFSRRFHERFVPGSRWDVRFTVRRLPFLLQHAAARDARALPREMVFPTPLAHPPEDLTASAMSLRNRHLNPEQELAVRGALRGERGDRPYLIFGPPGTGKTTAVVECALQLVAAGKAGGGRVRLLLVAPSNSAADLLAQRVLHELPKRKLLRINAYQRPRASVPPDLLDCCSYDSEAGAFVLPPAERLEGATAVAATLMTAGRLARSRHKGTRHPCLPATALFTHVLLDEAGHAVEPEALCGVTRLLAPGGRLVLAGDPKQLGPVVRAGLAARHGLAVSMLERLMAREAYLPRNGDDIARARARLVECGSIDEGDPPPPPDLNPAAVTMLTRNYRAHPALLQLPSRLFYGGALVPAADPAITESLCDWEGLESPGTCAVNPKP